MDDVVPLVIRQITVQEAENSIEWQQQTEADPHTSTVKWLQPLSCQQLATAQKDDPVLFILHDWNESGIVPTREQVTMESPAVRKYLPLPLRECGQM